MPKTIQEKKDSKREYMSRYYLDNKDKINERRYVKHDCPICYGRYSLAHKTQHERTQRHVKALRSVEHTQENV